MTTPAKDIDITSYSSGKLVARTTYKDGSPPTDFNATLSGRPSGRKSEKRPKSTSNPFIGSTRWRNPAPWSHSGFESVEAGSYFTAKYEDAVRVTNVTYSGPVASTVHVLKNVPLPTISSNLRNRTEVKALNKLKDQDIHLGEFFGEFRQTSRMVASTARKIRKDFLTFKKKHPKEVKRLRRARNPVSCSDCQFSDRWLEMTYGWTPLLSDLHGALEHLLKSQRELGMLVHARASSQETSNVTVEESPGITQLPGTIVSMNVEQKSKVYVDLWMSLRAPTLQELSSLGIVNPVETIWELTRYSFVVDWFLPIGPWLSSLTGDAGFQFKSATRSEKREARVTSSTWKLKSDVGKEWKGGGGLSLKAENSDFKRVVYTGTPVPGFYLKNPLSVKHVISAIALLAQAFRS